MSRQLVDTTGFEPAPRARERCHYATCPKKSGPVKHAGGITCTTVPQSRSWDLNP